MNAGIPAAIQALTVGFKYNNLESARALFERHPHRIATLILKPSHTEGPAQPFLNDLMELCHKNEALLILDEIITGFRWHAGGAQKLYSIEPNLSYFGKALGNSFSVSTLAGKRKFMNLGSITQVVKPKVFLLSTTHGAETHTLAAAIATMRIYQNKPVIEHLHAQRRQLRSGVQQSIARHDLASYIGVTGRDCCLAYTTLDTKHLPSQAFRTLFLQETIRRGVLMPSLVVSYTHTDEDIDRTIDAIDKALAVYKKALQHSVDKYLVSRASQPVFRRFNSPDTPAPVLKRVSNA